MDRVAFLFDGWAPVARVLVVGTGAYVALVVLLRITGKRTLAQMNAFDFVVTVALGAVFGSVLTAPAISLVEAVAAFALLIVLQLVVTWLKVRSPRFAEVVTAPPTLVYYQGRLMRGALRRERITEAELLTAVREHGAGSLDEVEAIVLESNGRFAVVKRSAAGDRDALPAIDR